MGATGNRVGVNASRGFESRPLRHLYKGLDQIVGGAEPRQIQTDELGFFRVHPVQRIIGAGGECRGVTAVG